MLVLTRKPAETIRIGSDIVVKVIRTQRGTVKLGIDAPEDVRIVRGELCPAVVVRSESPASGAFSGAVTSDQFPHVA